MLVKVVATSKSPESPTRVGKPRSVSKSASERQRRVKQSDVYSPVSGHAFIKRINLHKKEGFSQQRIASQQHKSCN